MEYGKIKELCIKKIKNNIYDGILYASPSYTPNYRYYWIRDAALVYRCIIDEHINNKIYLSELLNYIETERRVQKTKTLTGIGEPKLNPDTSAYNESWGRPQNDGPALRGMNMIKLYHFFYKQKYNSLCDNVIMPLIKTDIEYILDSYNKPCFDLWEEIYGWHFYTRVVQFKFVKEYSFLMNKYGLDYDKDRIEKQLYDMLLKINHHNNNNSIISSFRTDGTIEKTFDSSIIMALTHIDYDETIIDTIGIEKFKNSAENIAREFRNRYKEDSLNMVGRYINDKYYDGHIWIICTLAFAQFYLYLYIIDKHFFYKKKATDMINYIIQIDKNIDISEQYDIDSNEQVSAEKLSWNYSELFFCCKFL